MPDIPEEAVSAAALVVARNRHTGPPVDSDRKLAAEILDAAAPVLDEALLTPLAKRHAMIPGERGGGYCGTCWTKGGSRAAWPCGEILAIAEILPVGQNHHEDTGQMTTPGKPFFRYSGNERGCLTCNR